MRRAAVVCCALALAACGGAQQRGPGGGGQEVDTLGARLEGAGVVLVWCERTAGRACAQVTEIFDVVAITDEDVPERLLGPMVDEDNDCEAEGIDPVLRTVEGATGIQHSNWHDNAGHEIPRIALRDTFMGGGCTNCCWDASEPPVKVHMVAGEEGGERLFLVRVWEKKHPAFVE